MTTVPPQQSDKSARRVAKAKRQKRMMKIWGGIFAGLMLTGMSAAYLITHKPGSVKIDAGDIEADSLNKPGKSNDEIAQWAEEIVPGTTSFVSAQFYNQINDLEQYFTKNGWKFYRGMLDRYDLIKLLRAGSFSITPNIDAPPEFLEQGVDNRVYYWKIKLKMTLVMQSDTRRLDQPMSAHVRIVRVPHSVRSDGVAIDSLNFLPNGPAVPVPMQ